MFNFLSVPSLSEMPLLTCGTELQLDMLQEENESLLDKVMPIISCISRFIQICVPSFNFHA